jgi:16S rRNA (guanine(966)-N(2))-methyltransferase RsmD
MRVIAGEFRSRQLKSLPGLRTRPTPDRLREALFNILAPEIGGAVFLDAYAGTGAVGIEALSRGARHAIFIESSRSAVSVIRDNLRLLGAERRAEVVTGRVLSYLPHRDADIVFLDPPYEHSREYVAALEALASQKAGLVIAQHETRLELAPEFGALTRTRVVHQGDNALSFYRRS